MKKSVNLIITSKHDSIWIHRFQIFLPIISVIGLLAFIGVFFTSIVYVNTNLKEYDILKKDLETAKSKVEAKKITEGIFNITLAKLDALEQILSQKKSYLKIISDVNGIPKDNIVIDGVKIKSDGGLSFQVIASSSAAVDDLVSLLLLKEQRKMYTDIEAQGFSKDKIGNYGFTIVLKSDPSMLK